MNSSLMINAIELRKIAAFLENTRLFSCVLRQESALLYFGRLLHYALTALHRHNLLLLAEGVDNAFLRREMAL